MNNPLGVSPSKGKQETTRGKEKSFDLGGNRTHDLRIRSTVTLPTELQGRTEKAMLRNLFHFRRLRLPLRLLFEHRISPSVLNKSGTVTGT